VQSAHQERRASQEILEALEALEQLDRLAIPARLAHLEILVQPDLLVTLVPRVYRVHRDLREVLGTKVRQEIKAVLVLLVKQVLLAQLVYKETRVLRDQLGGLDQLALRVHQVTQELPDWLDLWVQLGHQD